MHVFCMYQFLITMFLLTWSDHAYFINYYGEDCARLNFDQTVHGWRYHPSLLMTFFAPLFFMEPTSKL